MWRSPRCSWAVAPLSKKSMSPRLSIARLRSPWSSFKRFRPLFSSFLLHHCFCLFFIGYRREISVLSPVRSTQWRLKSSSISTSKMAGRFPYFPLNYIIVSLFSLFCIKGPEWSASRAAWPPLQGLDPRPQESLDRNWSPSLLPSPFHPFLIMYCLIYISLYFP